MEELTNEILIAALQFHIDDIHLLPFREEYRFYLRDGEQLSLLKKIDLETAHRWITFIKYRSGMDVGEKRRPQSGAMKYVLKNGRSIELRLSVISNFKMQISVVIRLLHLSTDGEKSREVSTYFPKDIDLLQKMLHYKSGLILFSGPVSSGKTTTMYHLLRNRVNDTNLQVITMEEPVEMSEPMFLQTEINEKAGITYELLIKSSLRHHPDMMLIGEIRDEMTAKMVIRGALTGHLMLATVHAKDCKGVISRLEELGVTKDLLRQTLVAVVAQRLVPRYCFLCQSHCCFHCNHIPLSKKKATIFDIAYGSSLQHLIQEEEFLNPLLHQFNRKLRKAYALGYISQESFEAYKIY